MSSSFLTTIPSTSTFGNSGGLGIGSTGGFGGISTNPGSIYNGFPSAQGTATTFGLQGSLGAMPNFGLGGGGFGGIMALGALMGPIFALINLMARNKQNKKAKQKEAEDKAKAKEEAEEKNKQKEATKPNPLKQPSPASTHGQAHSPNQVSFQ